MFTIFLGTLEAGLNLLVAKEGNRALDLQERFRKLRREYYEEKQKPDPNMAVLDDLEHKLWLLGSTFSASQAVGQTPSPQGG